MNWVSHVILETHNEKVREQVRKFFQESLLNWIELCADHKRLPGCIVRVGRLLDSMEKMRDLVTLPAAGEDIEICGDILSFLRSNQILIQGTPKHVYSSALMFTPRQSSVYRIYEPRYREKLPRMRIGYVEHAQRVITVSGHDINIVCVAISPTGSMFASVGYDRTIILWDTRSWSQLLTITVQVAEGRERCVGITFLPGSHEIVSLWADCIQKHSVETGDVIRIFELSLEVNNISTVAWPSNYKYLAYGAASGNIRLISMDAGDLVGEITAVPEGGITSLSVSPDGSKVASTGRDHSIKVWSLHPDHLSGPDSVCEHTSWVVQGAFLPSGPSLFAFIDGEALHILDMAEKKIVSSYPATAVESLTCSQDGQYISTTQANWGNWHEPSLRLRKLVPGSIGVDFAEVCLDGGSGDVFQSSLFSPDGKSIIAASQGTQIKVQSLDQVDPIEPAKGHVGPVLKLKFSSNRKLLVSASADESVCTWNVEKESLEADRIQVPSIGGSAFAVSSDGSVVACGNEESQIQFWSTKMKKIIGPTIPICNREEHQIVALSFSPNDDALAILGVGSRYDPSTETSEWTALL
ncbi:hypothetical protein M408DRAFT_13452, partial [Serendipita vermifera MAFF 305830]